MTEPTRRRVGRPRLPGSAKYIRLREIVFNLWRSKKENLGYMPASDSEFAEFLLHRRLGGISQGSENNPLWFPANAGENIVYSVLVLQGSFSQSTDDNLFDPKQIAPTIGMNAAPSTEELMKDPSRFSQPMYS